MQHLSAMIHPVFCETYHVQHFTVSSGKSQKSGGELVRVANRGKLNQLPIIGSSFGGYRK